jgi:drug/metabolite transporter (DMT)-like permease
MRHYLSIILAAVIFGSSGVFIKTLGLPVSSLTFFRMAVPLTVVSALFLIRGKFPDVRDPSMLLASFLNAVRLFFYFAGYAYGNISTTVILLYTWPVFATFWSVLFLGERLSPQRLVLFAATFSGVILITLNQTLSMADHRFAGTVYILLSAFIYSMTIAIFKKESPRYTPLETLWFQNLLGSFAFLPFLMMHRPLPALWQTGLACSYGGLIGVLGFGLFFFGLRNVEASRASFLTYVEVVSGICFGMVFFHERLSWNIVIGGSLVLLSALALSRKEQNPPGDG